MSDFETYPHTQYLQTTKIQCIVVIMHGHAVTSHKISMVHAAQPSHPLDKYIHQPPGGDTNCLLTATSRWGRCIAFMYLGIHRTRRFERTIGLLHQLVQGSIVSDPAMIFGFLARFRRSFPDEHQISKIEYSLIMISDGHLGYPEFLNKPAIHLVLYPYTTSTCHPYWHPLVSPHWYPHLPIPKAETHAHIHQILLQQFGIYICISKYTI